MNKFISLLILTFAVQFSYSYTWEPYGPESIKANKLCLIINEYSSGIICIDSGMYVGLINETNWEYFSNFNMPVIDAVECSYNVDSILVLMGCESYSDGIYSFNLTTGQFQIIDFCLNPNFIHKHYSSGSYYVGYEFGLLVSENGYTWNEISFFNGKICKDIQIYNDCIAVAVEQPTDNVFLSEDGGDNWETIIGGYKISELRLDYFNLFGISTENSADCGLFKLNEYSMIWENKFFTDNLNTIGFDNDGRYFLGWYEASGGHQGIAKYTDYTNSLTFYNLGLPNLNINDITSSDEFVGGEIVFCCTDAGVFHGDDYIVGILELEIHSDISIFPNPVSNQATIKINLTELLTENISIPILNNQGLKVDEVRMEGNNSNEMIIKWHKGDLPSGVYYLVVVTEKEKISKKFVIL